MSKKDDKQYCVVDHANKQLERDRRYPSRRANDRVRPGIAYCGKHDATHEAREYKTKPAEE